MPIQPIRCVSAVDAWIAVSTSRSLLFRGRGLSAKLWGVQQRQNLAKLRQRTSAQQDSIPAKQTPQKAEPEWLELPLHVTIWPGSNFDAAGLRTLIDNTSSYFHPAGIRLQLASPFEGEGNFTVSSQCPFQTDLDHKHCWLHLALIPEAPAQLYSCGRCMVLPSKSTPRRIAYFIGRLLGLEHLSQVGFDDRLMKGTKGRLIAPAERQWLREQVGLLQGSLPQFPLLTVPIWGYSVDSPMPYRSRRSRQQFSDILDLTNRLWEPAGIEFVLKAWCALGTSDLGSDFELEAGPWNTLTEHAPEALHFFMICDPDKKWDLAADPGSGFALMSDALQTNSSRGVAHTLGILLGLETRESGVQLLARQSIGHGLSATDIRGARRYAQDLALLEKPPTVFSKPCFPATSVRQGIEVKTVPIHVHIKVQLDSEQVQSWMEQVNHIFAPVGIRLAPTYCSWHQPDSFVDLVGPKAKETPEAWQPITQSAGYRRWQLNLFLVDEIRVPRRNSHNYNKKLNCLLVAQYFGKHSPQKQIAIALARYWGLKFELDGPYYRLMTWNAPGVRLSPAQIGQLLDRFKLKREIKACQESLIRIQVVVSLVNQAGQLGLDEVVRLWSQVNSIWSQAGIEWVLSDCRHLQLKEELLEIFRPDLSTKFDLGLDPTVFQVLIVDEVRIPGDPERYMCKIFPKALGLAVNVKNIPRDISFSQGLAHLSGLKVREHGDPKLLTELKGGYHFEKSEIWQAREQTRKLGGQWQVEPYEGDDDILLVPVNLSIVNEAGGLTPLNLESLWSEVATIWSQAGILFELEGFTQVSLNDEQLNRLREHEIGILSMTSAKPALNLILVEDLPAANQKGSHLALQFHSKRTLVVNVSLAQTPVVLCLARALASFLTLKLTTNTSPDYLCTHFKMGCRFRAEDIETSRRWAQRLKDALAPPPSPDLTDYLETLDCKLQVYTRVGTTLQTEHLENLIKGAEAWNRAGIRFEVLSPLEIEITDQEFQTSLDQGLELEHLGTLGRKMSGSSTMLSLLLVDQELLTVGVHRTPAITFENHFYGVTVLRYSGDYSLTLGAILNVKQNVYLDEERMMGNGDGLELSALEIYQARQHLQEFLHR